MNEIPENVVLEFARLCVEFRQRWHHVRLQLGSDRADDKMV